MCTTSLGSDDMQPTLLMQQDTIAIMSKLELHKVWPGTWQMTPPCHSRG